MVAVVFCSPLASPGVEARCACVGWLRAARYGCWATVCCYANHTDVSQRGRGNSSGVPGPGCGSARLRVPLSSGVWPILNVTSCSGPRGRILSLLSSRHACQSLSDVLLVEVPVPLSVSHPLSLRLMPIRAGRGHRSRGTRWGSRCESWEGGHPSGEYLEPGLVRNEGQALAPKYLCAEPELQEGFLQQLAHRLAGLGSETLAKCGPAHPAWTQAPGAMAGMFASWLQDLKFFCSLPQRGNLWTSADLSGLSVSKCLRS